MSKSLRSDLTFVDNPTVVVRDVWKQYSVSDSLSEDAKAHRRSTKKSILVNSLKDISFVASSGESIGLIGRNGSGKSTLLSLIAGAQSPTTGDIFVKARPTLLGVAPALQPYLTGEQNIYLGCLAIGMSKEEAQAEVPKIAEWAEIGDAVKRPMNTYSAGQSARLVFAISTAISPEILLVDEALSTGDAAFARKAERRMGELLEGTGNLFLVSHSTNQITKNCKRVLWLNQGELIADASAAELIDTYEEWSALKADSSVKKANDLLEEVKQSYSSKEVLFERELEEQLDRELK